VYSQPCTEGHTYFICIFTHRTLVSGVYKHQYLNVIYFLVLFSPLGPCPTRASFGCWYLSVQNSKCYVCQINVLCSWYGFIPVLVV